MRFLRKNTAVRITVGPFLDKTDGVTPEVALTVTNCKLTATVDADDGSGVTLVLDTNPTASGGNNDMVHITNDDAGYYDLELAAANVNYNGRFHLALTDAANHCPVFHEFMILDAVAYDSFVKGSDLLQVDLQQLLGLATGVTAFERSARSIVLGTVTTGASTTSIPTSSLVPSAGVADQFKGRIVIFDKDTATANLRGQASDITASTSGGTLTVMALTTAPASGDTFVIV